MPRATILNPNTYLRNHERIPLWHMRYICSFSSSCSAWLTVSFCRSYVLNFVPNEQQAGDPNVNQMINSYLQSILEMSKSEVILTVYRKTSDNRDPMNRNHVNWGQDQSFSHNVSWRKVEVTRMDGRWREKESECDGKIEICSNTNWATSPWGHGRLHLHFKLSKQGETITATQRIDQWDKSLFQNDRNIGFTHWSSARKPENKIPSGLTRTLWLYCQPIWSFQLYKAQ